jgi:hypothetical protein
MNTMDNDAEFKKVLALVVPPLPRAAGIKQPHGDGYTSIRVRPRKVASNASKQRDASLSDKA